MQTAQDTSGCVGYFLTDPYADGKENGGGYLGGRDSKKTNISAGETDFKVGRRQDADAE